MTQGLPNRPKPNGQTVPVLPSSQSAPFWLLRLCALQRRFSVVTFLLVTAMLTVYGWTVYSQHMWNQAYSKLVILQRNERQLTTTNEVLKNQMALQAEQSATGLVPPNPAQVIFLKPEPQRSNHPTDLVPHATKPAAQTEKQTLMPLGY